MGDLPYALVFLLFDFNLTFSFYGDPAVHVVYLLPRFIGYLILFFGCKGLRRVERFDKSRSFFALAAVLGALKCFCGYALYHPVFVQAAAILSVCAMLYTLYLITETVLEIERKQKLEAGAAKLKTLWRWIALFGVASAVCAVVFPAASLALWLLAALCSVGYLVRLLRSKAVMRKTLPGNQAEKYR